jgi:carbon starvation protein CstA
MLLSTSVLWLATKYLFDRGAFHWIVSLPAVVGTCVTISYIVTAGIGFGVPQSYGPPVGIVVGVAALIVLIMAHKSRKPVMI